MAGEVYRKEVSSPHKPITIYRRVMEGIVEKDQANRVAELIPITVNKTPVGEPGTPVFVAKKEVRKRKTLVEKMGQS